VRSYLKTILGAVAAFAFAAPAMASPITYTEVGTGSGALDGTLFTNQLVTIGDRGSLHAHDVRRGSSRFPVNTRKKPERNVAVEFSFQPSITDRAEPDNEDYLLQRSGYES
jgi:hypothetical protein